MKEVKPSAGTLSEKEAEEKRQKEEEGRVAGNPLKEVNSLESLLIDILFDAFGKEEEEKEKRADVCEFIPPEGFRVLSAEERSRIEPQAFSLLQDLHLLGVFDAEVQEEILEYALGGSSEKIGLLEIKQAIALVLSVKMPERLYSGISAFLINSNHKLN